ncbi:M61 family metallopeptidase [Ketobacter sp.]|uniref:M61 family metallopeptidase n=1 Tax=Ketobacter sp. TaxID=2083498 RepID=UPI000F1EF310|nr:PDZ domain-containing protein [Ketobacter sp.]RLT96344.1 MAG: M61 family peptidase [Ketobacter sp.]
MNHACELHYSITPIDPYAHVFAVQLDIPFAVAAGQRLRLPSWIPGSYMIRDFAKNIVTLHGECDGQRVTLTKVDKQTWSLPACDAPLSIHYQVYAWDMSVRAAHLDQNHAYFNGTSVFLELEGYADTPCTVDIHNATIPEARHWRVGTSLPTAGAEQYGFGRYRAENYSDLIDHPVEIADFSLVSFEACGVPHDFALTGLHNADLERLADDLKIICEYQINLFGGTAPFDRYVFITWAVGNGYGGLEHRASTSLICNRDDLPCRNERGKVSDGYKTFLGLCSHEYFHSWNVKRIQPDIPYDLSRENHTPLLWAFEGITSYYDDLTLVRTGLISAEDYLELVGKTITRILRNPGRTVQSTADSSFDTWTKFYKQDENAANAIVSYYTKGALIALGLDLTLRRLSQGAVNLDHIMVQLWQRHGRTHTPVAEFDIQNLCRASLAPQGADALAALDQYLDNAIYGTDDFDFAALFDAVGVRFHTRPATSASDGGGKPASGEQTRLELGLLTTADNGGAKVQRVLNGSSAHRAGISAGDTLIALNRIRLDNGNLEKLLARYEAGDQVDIVGFRRDELMQFQLTLEAGTPDTAYLQIQDAERLKGWIR